VCNLPPVGNEFPFPPVWKPPAIHPKDENAHLRKQDGTGITCWCCAIEASEFGWKPPVGSRGHKIGMNTFGASAPLKELQTKSGFTTRRIVEAAKLQTTRQLT